MKLKPYTGPHAGHLYHVVDDQDRVIRNASVLEVKLWEESKALALRLTEALGQVLSLLPALPECDGRDELQQEVLELIEITEDKASL